MQHRQINFRNLLNHQCISAFCHDLFICLYKSFTATFDSIIIIMINDYEYCNWVAICLCQDAHQIKIKPIQDHVIGVQFCAATFKE